MKKSISSKKVFFVFVFMWPSNPLFLKKTIVMGTSDLCKVVLIIISWKIHI